MSLEDEVRSASERFYTALNRMLDGNADPLAEIWSHDADVTIMHPIGGREVGWESVGGSWSQVASLATGGRVELRDRLIRVDGDMAYDVGSRRARPRWPDGRCPSSAV
jgi:ketosteroid isomerase-like protein